MALIKYVILAAVLFFVLAGCAGHDSLDTAGVGSLKIDCQAILKTSSSQAVTCIDYKSGRELGQAKAEIRVLDAAGKLTKVVKFELSGVKAFEGQRAAEAAVKSVTKDITESVKSTLPAVVREVVKGVSPPAAVVPAQ